MMELLFLRLSVCTGTGYALLDISTNVRSASYFRTGTVQYASVRILLRTSSMDILHVLCRGQMMEWLRSCSYQLLVPVLRTDVIRGRRYGARNVPDDPRQFQVVGSQWC
jgi:hypothetical protein